MPDSHALIVGASRGLGLGLAREFLSRDWHVIATARGENPPQAVEELSADYPGRLMVEPLDVVVDDEIAELRSRLSDRRLDLLFLNAGIGHGRGETLAATSAREFSHVMLTNAYGPMRTIEALQDLVHKDGVIAVMSSGLGSIANNQTGTWEVYRASKAALNMLMHNFAARDKSRTLLAITPGWVRTDMGGPNATLDVETSVRGIADVITARRGTPGLAFLNYKGEAVPW
ncbi:MAG TPA: SDR family NAD(P)-dependent oxidoreductase [Acetobacteraceae bacterium]|nr:SDR family NAD(P)-dependent oxidoreductase [Acetobacteraceae bacterium]